MNALVFRDYFSRVLPHQFRQRAVVADEVLRPTGDVGELRGDDVDSQPLVERGEDIADMSRRAAIRLLAPVPARRDRAEEQDQAWSALHTQDPIPRVFSRIR